MRAIIIILTVVALGCSRHIPIVSSDTVTKIEVREVLRDTTVFVTDSSGIRAYLECDSLGRVRIKEIRDYYAGIMVKVPKVVIKDNWLTADCVIDSAGVYIAWKERHVKETVKIDTVVKEKPTFKDRLMKIWGRFSGYAFLLLLIGAVVFWGLSKIKR